MRIAGFRISACHVIGLPNYSSYRVEASIEVLLDADEELAQARERAQVQLRALLEDTYRSQRKAQQEGGQ